MRSAALAHIICRHIHIDEMARSAMLMVMKKRVKLLRDALHLPAEARAALAAKLIDSLDSDLDEDAEERWSEEIERRLADVDAGHVSTIPWSEVRTSILRD